MHTLRFISVGMLLLVGIGALAARLPSNALYFSTSVRAETRQAQIAARRERMRTGARSMERLRQQLVNKQVISPRAVMPKLDTLVVTGNPKTRVRSLTRDANVLTFAYSGWTPTDQGRLQTFLTRAYPVLVSLYGAPASSATVTLYPGEYSTDPSGGLVEINNETGAVSITVPAGRFEQVPADFETDDGEHYGSNLLHLVLHAFHAPYLMGYDAWEEGMARAAAVVASTQLDADYDPTYDESYLLTIYDYLNQPSLSNATFFPPQGQWSDMTVWRIGMATSAWLKIYAERPYPQPSAFAVLNELYYNAVAANPEFAGNLVSLKSLLANPSVTPNGIEGLPALTWYDKQYVLKPQTVSGSRVFVYLFPAQEHVPLLIHYFFTGTDGSETPLTGTANLHYYTYDGIEYFPPEGNEVTIPNLPGMPGVGFIDPGFYHIGDPGMQRVRITVTVNGLRSTHYYPYGVEGFAFDQDGNVSDVNEFYGTVIGADTGVVNLALPGQSLNPNLVQGAFGANLTTAEYGISFFSPVIYTVNANGVEVNIRKNVGPGFYIALLRVGDESHVSLTHTFVPGPHMISFPFTPDIGDIGQMLGYTPGTPVSMAWWDPATHQYKYHPDVPPIVPGRAYWFNPPTTFSPLIAGTLPEVDDPRNVELVPGWNMIGNTFNAGLNVWATVIDTGTVAYTLPEAMLAGLVEPVWRYGSGGYYEVAPTLSAWEGGWIRNLTPGTLVLRQQEASRSTRAVQDPYRLLTDGGWGIRLQATAGMTRDAMAVAGINPKARGGIDGLDWQKPPAMGSGVRVAFINPANRIAGAAYATDIRPGLAAGGETWEFEVTTPQTETVTLAWPDLRGLPRGYDLILEDLTSGQRRYMRTAPAYQYNATGVAGLADVRRFRMTVQPQITAPLSFLDFRIAPTRGKGASVSVRLNATADLRMEVRAPSGKLVRVITANAVLPQEDTLIPWDGLAAGGKLIPAGTYLFTVTARSPEGAVLRRNMAFTIGR
ncbi:MAG: FlgD immunoglobulin-like domain containing protein [Armatimonadota bacterium]